LFSAPTRRQIHTYTCEGPALAFVRDIVFGHEDAAQFELRAIYADEKTSLIAGGRQLLRRALEDRVL
jgi:hypothetical protein